MRINRRTIPCLATLLLAPLDMLCANDVAKPFKPNILLILADDLGYGDVSFNGSPDIRTPHIDSIAKNGARCTSGYVSAPMCAPSRCGLLTGRYQQRFGYEANKDLPGIGLPLTETLISQRLKPAGYATGAIGKWHLGREAQFHPLSRGFDEFFGFLPGATNYMPNPAGKSILLRNREPAPHTEYLTHQFGSEAASFVERHRAEPWFLYLAFNAPHTPLEAPPDYLARAAHVPEGPRRTYAAMVMALDDNVGRLLAKLRETGQEERTLIVFLSDNGAQRTIGARAGNNDPFSGEKGGVREGGIRVPFAWQWPAAVPAGRVIEQPVSALDLLPTFLAAAGVTPQPDWKLDGVNLLAALQNGAAVPPRHLYWRMNQFLPNPPFCWAVLDGDWKLFHEVVRDEAGRLVRDQSIERLVNLTSDVREETDLSADHSTRRKALLAEWERWNSELMEPFSNQIVTSVADKSGARATDRDSIFTRWDKNKDGQLSLAEYIQGIGPSVTDAPERFKRLDKDKNGSLSREEFVGQEK